MKVDIEKMKELGLCEEPRSPAKKTRAAPDRVPGIQIKSKEERVPGVRLKSQRPKKHDFMCYPLWVRQGAAAMAVMFAICLTVTAVWASLGPPGNVSDKQNAMMAASVADIPEEQGNTVQVTKMDVGSGRDVIEVMQMSMKNVPEQIAEQESVITEIPEDEGAASEHEETDATHENKDTTVNEQDSEDASERNEDAEGETIDGETGDDDSSEVPEENVTDEQESDEESDEESDGESDEESDGESDEELDEESDEESDNEPDEEEVLLAIAKVDGMLNVRAEASEDAEVVGMLYKDAGGKILDQSDGWTQIESGDLTGWVQDKLLETTTEEELLSSEKAVMEAKVTVSSLNVRTDSSTDAQIIGAVKNGDTVEVIDVQDDGWAEVAYNDSTAYINTNYTEVGLSLQTGDTIEAYIEKVAEQKKAKIAQAEENAADAGLEVTVTEEYVPQDASDIEMLATIIYCEAGNQSHEGKVAVGNVVLNRVASSRFPNDINSVLRQKTQFQPVGEGKYDRLLNSGRIPQSCYDAAQEAMDGISYVSDCLYFKNPKKAGAHSGINIGDHVFW